MITLILDTSTEKSVVAIAQGPKLLCHFFLPTESLSSRNLATFIQHAFQEINLQPSKLESIAVGIGPGAYTGIRVSVAAAYGLAFPSKLPLVGFCSLEGFIPQGEGPFASLIDARSGGYYVLLACKTGDRIETLSHPKLVLKEDLENYLTGYPTHTGPHIDYPNPLYLAQMADRRLASGQFSNHLNLIYLRESLYC